MKPADSRCPTCNSPSPAKHPAMQFEGEVQICKDAFHKPADSSPGLITEAMLAECKGDTQPLRNMLRDRNARIAELERELAQRDGLLAKADEDLQLVQRALAFWHPGVGGRNDDAFLTRAGDDAMLLFGCAGPMENSAVELGWIKVIPDAAVTGEKP